MSSKTDSSDMRLGSIKCTETEQPDGSAVFSFEGSPEDFQLIIKAGITDMMNRDLLDLKDFLAPNWYELSDEEQIENYFFAHTVKTGLMNLIESTKIENQGELFE